MSELRFTDGMTIKTDGAYRVIRKSDGWYVVGRGMMCPVASPAEGDGLIADLMEREPESRRRGGR